MTVTGKHGSPIARPRAELHEAALRLCHRGLSVVPVGRDKRPLVAWARFQKAPADAEQVNEWWTRWPEANVGVVTGAVSGIVVLDADGPEGLASLKALGTPATTWLSKTARGWHQFFRYPEDGVTIRNSTGLRPGLDVRGDGGYVIVPPSLHASGRRYAWRTAPGQMALAPIPANVLTLLAGPTNGHGVSDRNPRDIPEGRRNDALYRCGRSLKAKGLSADAIKAALLEANRTRCKPPLPEDEVEELATHAATHPDRPSFAPATGEGRPTLTDAGNARRFARQHGAMVRYCYDWHRFLIWDDARWRPDAGALVMRLAKETARAIYDEPAGEPDPDRRKKIAAWAGASESEVRLRAMLALAQSEAGVPVDPADLDRDPWLLNVLNGTLDLRSGELSPHRRGDLITKLAPVEYDPTATCQRWTDFLDRILGGNERLIAYVQRAAGYSLTGDTSEQCLFMPYGTGANGKTTLLGTLQSLLGDYAIGTRPETLMLKGPDTIPNDVARLRGSRLVVAVEAEEGRRLAESLVKQMTGGDVMTARFMRAEFFDFSPTFKLWLASNHKPTIRGTDHAIWRRIRLIPFTVTIPEAERDRHFKDKLRSEWPGILRWAVKGCRAWQREGLREPEEVRAATETYRAEMDVLGAFLAERCVIGRDERVSAADLYDSYADWCRATGERWSLTKKALGTKLGERGFTSKKIGGRHVWFGVRGRSAADGVTAPFGDEDRVDR